MNDHTNTSQGHAGNGASNAAGTGEGHARTDRGHGDAGQGHAGADQAGQGREFLGIIDWEHMTIFERAKLAARIARLNGGSNTREDFQAIAAHYGTTFTEEQLRELCGI